MAGDVARRLCLGRVDELAWLDMADAGKKGEDLKDEAYDGIFVIRKWGLGRWGRGYNAVEAREIHDAVNWESHVDVGRFKARNLSAFIATFLCLFFS